MHKRQGSALRIVRKERLTLVDQEMLRRAYGAYNARNAVALISLTHSSVRWGHGSDGGYVSGHAGLRELWAREWSKEGCLLEPLSFHETEDGAIVVEVVRRRRKGALLQESMLVHTFTLSGGLIDSMKLG